MKPASEAQILAELDALERFDKALAAASVNERGNVKAPSATLLEHLAKLR